MSEESTTPDLVGRWQRAAEAHARRDFDEMISFFAPDAVWDGSSAGIGAYFEGATAIRSFLEEWLGAYEEYEHKQEKAQDLGNGVVFAVVLVDARLAGSAGRVQEQWCFTATWEADLIVQVTGTRDPDEARADAERLAGERA